MDCNKNIVSILVQYIYSSPDFKKIDIENIGYDIKKRSIFALQYRKGDTSYQIHFQALYDHENKYYRLKVYQKKHFCLILQLNFIHYYFKNVILFKTIPTLNTQS